MDAYVFGEQVVDIKFKNEVIDSIIAEAIRCEKRPNDYQIHTIYAGTFNGSPARRLMADLIADEATKSDAWTDCVSRFEKDVLVDVVKAMLEIRPAPRAIRWESCQTTYHEQPTEEST
jgi:hypothetical protein